MENGTPTPTEQPERTDWKVYVFVLAAMILAAWWRLHHITAWPLAFHQTIQYRNAVNTRMIYLKLAPRSLTEGERTWLEGLDVPLKGLPLTEIGTAILYHLAGEEDAWLSGLVTCTFWLAGGWFLFLLSRKVTGPYPALVALAYFLFNPFGIVLSRGLQQEAVMLLGFIMSLWYLVTFDVVSNWRRCAIAGGVVGLAVLLKPGICLVPLATVWIGLALKEFGLRQTVLYPGTYIYLLFTAFPSLLFAHLFLPGQDHQLVPQLLFTAKFYEGWWDLVGYVIGHIPLLGAVIGAVLLTFRCSRFAFAGCSLLLGYVGYAAIFTYANWTHDYYLVPLMPIVALNLAALVDVLFQVVRWRSFPDWLQVVVLAAGLYLAGYSQPESADVPDRLEDVVPKEERNLDVWIGEKLGKGTTVLSLAGHYGYSLTYEGWLNTHFWPSLGDKWYDEVRGAPPIKDEVRLEEMIATYKPAYFVITLQDHLRGQPELAAILKSRYEVVHGDSDVLIYDLRSDRSKAKKKGS